MLFYQRRDLSQMSRRPQQSDENEEEYSNGIGTHQQQPVRVNGDASSVEDMDTN